MIAWTEDMNTGIDAIDHQHQRIVDYINQLGSAIHLEDRTLVGDVIEELIDYTMSHFAFEESLLDEANYSLSKPHKAVHEVFIKRVTKFKEKHEAHEYIAKELHDLLRTWLVHHIKRDDMAYVADVKASITQIVHDQTEKGWVSRTFNKFFGKK